MDTSTENNDYNGFNPESPKSKELFEPFIDIIGIHQFEEAFDSSEKTIYKQKLDFSGESHFAVDNQLVPFVSGDNDDHTITEYAVSSQAENNGLTLNLITINDIRTQNVTIRSDEFGFLTATEKNSDQMKAISDDEMIDIFCRAANVDPLSKFLVTKTNEDVPTFSTVNKTLANYWERLAEHNEGTIVTSKLLEVQLPTFLGDHTYGRLFYEKTEDPRKSKERLVLEKADKFVDLDAERITRLEIELSEAEELDDKTEAYTMVLSDVLKELTIARIEKVDLNGTIKRVVPNEEMIQQFIWLLNYVVDNA